MADFILWLMGVVLVVSMLSIWLEKWFWGGVRIEEGEVTPEFRWLQRGYWYPCGQRSLHPMHREKYPFFWIKLPSWYYGESWHTVYAGAQPCWHQRCLGWHKKYGWIMRGIPRRG